MPSAAEEAQVDGIFREHGRGALLPFQVGSDKQHFTTSEGAVIVCGRYGRFAIALGDPTGPAGSEHAAWAAFVASCRSRDEIPAVYQASGQSRADLLALGLRPFRVGHEAIVDLTTFDLGGSKRANLRHTITRARKGGIAFHFYPSGIPAGEREALEPSMVNINRQWSAAAGPRLGFTIGYFDPAELHRIAVAVATGADGAAIAFATFRPTGVDGGWVLDLLRRAPGGTPGALEGCLAEAAAGLRETGSPTLSLGLAPLAGLDDASAVTEDAAWPGRPRSCGLLRRPRAGVLQGQVRPALGAALRRAGKSSRPPRACDRAGRAPRRRPAVGRLDRDAGPARGRRSRGPGELRRVRHEGGGVTEDDAADIAAATRLAPAASSLARRPGRRGRRRRALLPGRDRGGDQRHAPDHGI